MNYTVSGDLLVLIVISFVSFLAFSAARRYVRLRHVPGPPLAAFTDGWFFLKSWNGVLTKDLTTELHHKYGPVVRLGPNRVIFSDPAAISTIFSTTHLFQKARSYNPMVVLAGGKEVSSFITIRDEPRVSAMKKHLSSAFTANALLQQEGEIDHTIALLVGHLKKSGPTVDIASWLSYWAFDTLSRIAFTEDQEFMSHQEDLGATLTGARQRFDHWHYWYALPTLERLLFKNKIAQRFAKPSLLAGLAVQKIKAREASKDIEGHTDLLSRYLAASQKDPGLIGPADVTGLTVSTIHAGADTTATTMSILLYNLCNHPHTLSRLRKELSEAKVSSPPKFLELNKLEYLDSVIRESMRLIPTGADSVERTVPQAGAEICGVWIPGGTDVSVSHHVSNRDSGVWGKNPDEFDPDRWLQASDSQRRAMEKATLGFSAGKRMCLGQHLAWIEMKKLVTELLTNFKVSLVHPNEKFKTRPTAITAVESLELQLESR